MAPAERLFGVETEYAISALNATQAVDRGRVIDAMMHEAYARLVHLPDICSGGMFLENGGRFYIDCGQHPEMATPECTDPWSLVRSVQAGHRILFDLAKAAEAQLPAGTHVMCFRCNVDYCSHPLSTWGSHESYLHRMNPDEIPAQLLPHLVSRVIYTGAGGFNPFSSGLEFTLSPRAAHFRRVLSRDSTGDRGIYDTRDEPLCRDGYSRLHVICGESLCSETALFLKVGTTALIVAMAEAGLSPGSDVQLESPLDALRTFSADPSCKKSVCVKNWKRFTAIQIQRHYLDIAEHHLCAEYMPGWAGDVCRLWRVILDRLEEDPRTTDRILDWSIKYSLFQDQAARTGIPWERLSFWREIVHRLTMALGNLQCSERSLDLEFILGPQSPIPEEAGRLTRFLQSKGVEWQELQRILDSRPRFFQIDTRFGQLGPQGIFESLDHAGVLDHQVPQGLHKVRAAMEPPRGSRARIRGHTIRRLAAASGDWRCDWAYIANTTDNRYLDLSDPFTAEEVWKQPFQPDLEQPESGQRPINPHVRRLLEVLRSRR
jgi:hypothetical protein